MTGYTMQNAHHEMAIDLYLNDRLVTAQGYIARIPGGPYDQPFGVYRNLVLQFVKDHAATASGESLRPRTLQRQLGRITYKTAWRIGHENPWHARNASTRYQADPGHQVCASVSSGHASRLNAALVIHLAANSLSVTRQACATAVLLARRYCHRAVLQRPAGGDGRTEVPAHRHDLPPRREAIPGRTLCAAETLACTFERGALVDFAMDR